MAERKHRAALALLLGAAMGVSGSLIVFEFLRDDFTQPKLSNEAGWDPSPSSLIMDHGVDNRDAIMIDGSTIVASELPETARTWWSNQNGNPSEEIHLVSTPFGFAYKTETLLFGPCATVEFGYRKIYDEDSRYQTRCYDSDTHTEVMPLQRVYVPDLTGSHHSAIGSAVDHMTPVLYKWIPDSFIPVGIIMRQHPPAGTMIPQYSPIELEVSAGGPITTWDQLPNHIRAWLTGQSILTSEHLRGSYLLKVETPQGTAYKIDSLLFGPCAAVRSAYGSLQDDHYDTLTPEPCDRLAQS